jgi:hypothetical protein
MCECIEAICECTANCCLEGGKCIAEAAKPICAQYYHHASEGIYSLWGAMKEAMVVCSEACINIGAVSGESSSDPHRGRVIHVAPAHAVVPRGALALVAVVPETMIR